jgi:hypothetical protein
MRRTRERRDHRSRDHRRALNGAPLAQFRSSMFHAHSEAEAAKEIGKETPTTKAKPWERDWEAAAQLRNFCEENDQEG